jgi:hypothetical protein
MIVLSDQLQYTADEESDGVNGDNPRIGSHSVIDTANIYASASDSDWPASNLANQATFAYWQGTSIGVHRIGASSLGLETVNYIAIAGHNLIGSTLRPVRSVNGSVWTAIDDAVTVWDNEPFMYEFPDTVSPYVALEITPMYEVPAVACLNIGRVLRVQRRIYVDHRPMPLTRKTEVSSGYSESGQFLGRVKRSQSRSTDVQLENLTPDWYRTYFDPFAVEAEERAFWWAWRPQSYPDECAFAWLNGDPTPRNTRANGMMSVSMDLGGIGALVTGGADAS